MVKIIYVQTDGSENIVEGSPGFSLMEVAVRNGVAGIDAECGGACACATCHVVVDPEWYERAGAPSPAERDMLEFAIEPRATSRLSCQIRLNPSLDGLRVEIPDRQR